MAKKKPPKEATIQRLPNGRFSPGTSGNALVKSYRWNRQLDSGELTISDLARHERASRTYVSRIVNLMMLAPDSR